MNMHTPFIARVVLAAMVASSAAHAADAEQKNTVEKCYGIAKAGKNDCAAKDKSNSCAGRAQKNADANDWIYVPQGLCDKIAGGIKG
ncbi:MAG: hypothetical protein B7X02_00505 [Rhodospirillales bacterium 12-54-5]|nr:MAG: hypothetical protein B7X02_00505 [Rhodospirillales bacterium 12-54-5]